MVAEAEDEEAEEGEGDRDETGSQSSGASSIEMDDIEVPPWDPVRGHDQVGDVRRGARVARIGARRVARARPEDPEDVGRNDNYWCRNPEEVIAAMARIKRPWIAFKVLAAGAIPPRAGFSYALKNGADFLLVGMFDWQIAEDVNLARRMFANLERPRPLYG